MRKLIFSVLLATSVTASATCQEFFVDHLYPKAETVLCNEGYAVGFSTSTGTPQWTANVLNQYQVEHATVKRKDNFRADIRVPHQASVSVFHATGYDKGHLVPFEDLAYDNVAADESFLMTNIVPQISENNRQIWKAVEMKMRKLPKTYGPIFVITGPVYDGNSSLMKDGTKIPSYMFKIAFSKENKKSWAVLIPNQGLKAKEMGKYISSHEEISRRIGISFNLFNTQYQNMDLSK